MYVCMFIRNKELTFISNSINSDKDSWTEVAWDTVLETDWELQLPSFPHSVGYVGRCVHDRYTGQPVGAVGLGCLGEKSIQPSRHSEAVFAHSTDFPCYRLSMWLQALRTHQRYWIYSFCGAMSDSIASGFPIMVCTLLLAQLSNTYLTFIIWDS